MDSSLGIRRSLFQVHNQITNSASPAIPTSSQSKIFSRLPWVFATPYIKCNFLVPFLAPPPSPYWLLDISDRRLASLRLQQNWPRRERDLPPADQMATSNALPKWLHGKDITLGLDNLNWTAERRGLLPSTQAPVNRPVSLGESCPCNQLLGLRQIKLSYSTVRYKNTQHRNISNIIHRYHPLHTDHNSYLALSQRLFQERSLLLIIVLYTLSANTFQVKM